MAPVSRDVQRNEGLPVDTALAWRGPRMFRIVALLALARVTRGTKHALDIPRLRALRTAYGGEGS